MTGVRNYLIVCGDWGTKTAKFTATWLANRAYNTLFICIPRVRGMGIDPGGGGVLYTGVCNYLINWLPWGTQLTYWPWGTQLFYFFRWLGYAITYWGTQLFNFLRWLGYAIIPTVPIPGRPAGLGYGINPPGNTIYLFFSGDWGTQLFNILRWLGYAII